MKITSEQEMLDFGQTLANKGSVFELIGDVGAGKTTFVRGLAKGLGIKEPVTSPSFTISKSYATPDGKTLTHYDFYRLKDPGIMANDLKEKIKNGHIVVVEWANSVKNLLPKNHTTITITTNPDSTRNIDVFDNQKTTFQDISRPKKSESKKSPATAAPLDTNSQKQTGVHLFLDTSTPTTILKINHQEYHWDSDNTLAEKLLKFIHDKLQANHYDWSDITSITFMSGPGSFTGLRIGASVVNTLAHELNIPLKDHHGKLHQIIVPDYGRAANISQPKK